MKLGYNDTYLTCSAMSHNLTAPAPNASQAVGKVLGTEMETIRLYFLWNKRMLPWETSSGDVETSTSGDFINARFYLLKHIQMGIVWWSTGPVYCEVISIPSLTLVVQVNLQNASASQNYWFWNSEEPPRFCGKTWYETGGALAWIVSIRYSIVWTWASSSM